MEDVPGGCIPAYLSEVAYNPICVGSVSRNSGILWPSKEATIGNVHYPGDLSQSNASHLNDEVEITQ